MADDTIVYKILTRQAERIAGGDLSHRVPHTRRDELGVLAGSFNFMADQLQAQLATAKGRETRLCSLLQRAQTIITLDADIYTIWREDAGEELVK